jgi:L-alanine-DL-glutamate epimerase-like enolase superfamily enzyme
MKPKRNEITEEWRRLHNEDVYDMFSPDVMWVTRLKRTRWVGHVACTAEREISTGFWWGNLRERDHLKDLGKEGKIILE